LTEEKDQQRRRFLSITPQPDGMVAIRGLLDAETGAVAMTVLHALAAPNTTDTHTRRSKATPAAQPDPERPLGSGSDVPPDRDVGSNPMGHPDPDPGSGSGSGSDENAGLGLDADRPELVFVDDRSSGQRLHDALHQVCRQSLQSGDLPGCGGIPATVLITMTAEQFETRTGLATTGLGQRLTINQALRLADESAIAWLVHNSRGGILDYGRTRRLASEGQTLALIARDRGCAFPGCTRPPQWTQRHHITSWRHHGHTKTDNLCLLCPQHHRMIDTETWTIHMTHGVPYFIPPPWRDPKQRPIRNHAH
jgi:hypothetical protein